MALIPQLVITVVFLFTLLNIPVPSVIVSSLGDVVAASTAILGLVNYSGDLVTHPNPLLGILPTYDFIIVGAGSAGSVLANRLSVDYKVLLLDAGGAPLDPLTAIPAMGTYNLHHPETDWMYEAKSSPNYCLSCANNAVSLASGKMLGGGSSLNVMVYMRGNPNDFDNWSNVTGDSRWSYENVLPYFKKSEDYRGDYPDPTYHGTGGPLTVSSQANYHPMAAEWMAAGMEMGFSNSDANAYQTSTFYPIETTIKDGQRWSTYKAFIEPILLRTNLKVVRYAYVKKINFSPSKRAVGVTYVRNGQTITATASKEVILSAGAIASPKILMLSGIGRADHLTEMEIPVVSNLSVGDNLQDHVMSLVGPFILNDTVSFRADRDLTAGAAGVYVVNHTGPFAYNFLTGIGLFSTSDPPNDAWPNVYAEQAPLGIHQSFPEDYEFVFQLKNGTMAQYLDGFIGKDANFIALSLGRPKSVGTIRLKSKDPFDKPIIDLNFYDNPEDLQDMIKAIKFLIELYEETEAFQKYNATLIPNHFPGCESYTLRTDEYYECHLRHFTGSTWHPSGTVKMGKADDPTAVVDSNLRVFGVTGLRVIDASIMPNVTNANTNAPVIMIGEVGADMILDDWQ